MSNRKITRSTRNFVVSAFDTIVSAVAFFAAFYIRLGSDIESRLGYLSVATPAFALICLLVFLYMRLYRGLWRYASMRDLLHIVKSVTLATVVCSILMFFYNRMEGFPRSVLLISWMLQLILLGGARFVYRIFREQGIWGSLALNYSSKVPV